MIFGPTEHECEFKIDSHISPPFWIQYCGYLTNNCMDSYKITRKGFKITLALLSNYLSGTCDPNQANARLDSLRTKYHELLTAYEACPDEDPEIEK